MSRILVLVFVTVVVCGCKLFSERREGAPESGVGVPGTPGEATAVEVVGVEPRDVEKFVLDEWLDPQNKGDVEGYTRCLAQGFEGTSLDVTGSPTVQSLDEWVERRGKALRRKPVITVEEIEIGDLSDSDSIDVVFNQTWETDSYCDTGRKKLVVGLESGKLKVKKEIMETVTECPWVSVSTLLTFVDGYQRAVKKADTAYLAAHTCIPFTKEFHDYKKEIDALDEIQELSHVPTDVLLVLRAGPQNRIQKVDGVDWEAVLQVKNDDAVIMFGDLEDTDNHTFGFVFEEGAWKYCKHVQELTIPSE